MYGSTTVEKPKIPLYDQYNDKTSVMSDRNRLIRSLVTRKKSYIPMEKDYMELNKG